jgi:hypothetical protein
MTASAKMPAIAIAIAIAIAGDRLHGKEDRCVSQPAIQ